MKKLIALMALVFAAQTAALAANATQQIVVTGMTCSSCANSIKEAFKKHPEVKDVTVDVKSGKVVLTFQPEKIMTETQIREAVEGAGFAIKTVKTAG
jgi:Cd2+/Zn2+-exporting ATPase